MLPFGNPTFDVLLLFSPPLFSGDRVAPLHPRIPPPLFSLLSFLIKLSALAIVGFAGATCTVSLRRGVEVGTLLFPSAFNLEGVMTGADCDISSGGISLTMLYIFS
ncbi:unnamed protein product [Linum trigynum]|uniref:Uncharacterized protein n=1 Tax=Linum trigynum TaxID=586398 RepID=A0AAV2DI03_9ROSI